MKPFRERLEFHNPEALFAKTMLSCPEWAPSRTDSVLILGVPCTEGIYGAFGAKGAFTS